MALMDLDCAYDLVIHENFGISLASEQGSQRSIKTPRIKNVAGIVSLATRLGVPVLNESGNASLERTDLAAGISSKASVFKLQRTLVALSDTNLSNGGKLVVSKHLSKGYVEDESQRYDAFVRDMLFLSHASMHDNIVNVICIGWEDSGNTTRNYVWPVLILEFAEYGTLEDFFELDDTEISWKTKRCICCDVAAALDWLHKSRILHSDVKFGNVLMSANPESSRSSPYRAKLCDFGFALDIDALEASGKDTAQLEGFTPPCAPEAGSQIPLSLLYKFDIFSYGLLACRVFLNGNQVFNSIPSQDTDDDDEDYASKTHMCCAKLGSYDDAQLMLIKTLVASTTAVKPEQRIDMEQVSNLLATKIGENNITQISAAPVDFDDDVLLTIPEIEDVWSTGIFPKARATIVCDLLEIVKDFNIAEWSKEIPSPLTAKIMYQIYLAYLIGFGCEKSTDLALHYLGMSARLGYRDAQNEFYATHVALAVRLTSAEREKILEWLIQAILHGDKSCLQELQTFDESKYQDIATSNNYRKALCERSGFIFDDDFIESNDVRDVERFISIVEDSGEPLHEDIGGGMTWLHYAVFMNSFDLATRLLADPNFPIDARNCKGQTPLWIACLSGNYEMAILLLAHNADARIQSDHGLNCLHHLAAFDNFHATEIARLLHVQGADVNGQSVEGLTPLHYAIRGSGALLEDPSVEALLDLGADPLICDEDGDTALDSAIDTMRIFSLKSILSCDIVNALPKANLHQSLAKALGTWIRQMKHYRLRLGSSYYKERLSQLVQLLHTDDILPVYVTDHPVGFTPLHDAYAWSSDDVAAELIKLPNVKLNELDSGQYGYPPLMIALRTSTLPTIQNLLEAGADPLIRARTGENILHQCVQYNPELLSYMCKQIEERHGDVATMCNQESFRKGQTPLDYALSLGRADAARFLLEKGANPNIFRETEESDGSAYNSLRSCLLPPSVPMLQLLLPYMDPGSFVCCSNGLTLLHLACIHIHDEARGDDNTIASFINTIITHFPDAVDAPAGISSITPLHLAAAYGNLTAVKVLLRRGASPVVTDVRGERPIDMIDDDEDIVDKNGNTVVGIIRHRLLKRWRNTKEVLLEATNGGGL